MESTPNQRLTADQFSNLQFNAPTAVEDRGIVDGDRLMIVHLEAVAAGHANLDADFSHELDGRGDLDWKFEACGQCVDLGEKVVFDQMIKKMIEEFPEQ